MDVRKALVGVVLAILAGPILFAFYISAQTGCIVCLNDASRGHPIEIILSIGVALLIIWGIVRLVRWVTSEN